MKRFAGWIPIRIYWNQAVPVIDWGYLGDVPLTDPFFEQTIQRALNHPANLLFRHQTSVDVLDELAHARPGLSPTAFIFHMSRCGSTLISQMLASLPSSLVISEASPIDAILRSHFRDPRIPEAQRVQWLQWLVSALGQPRHPEQRHFFIKFDCWHALFLPLIRRAFPAVPWVFVYRQPVEVMMSQHTQKGAQMIPGVLEPELFGWTSADWGGMGLEEYGARVLARICETALDQTLQGAGKLLNYQQLPAAVWTALVQAWGIPSASADVERMREVSRLNAKNPVWLFEDDTAAKNAGATHEVRDLAGQWLEGIYQQLEKQRHRIGFT